MRSAVVTALASSCAAAGPGLSTTAEWIAPGGGSFTTPSNWSTGVAPGPGETALFDLNLATPVTLSSSRSVAGLQVDRHVLTLDATGQTLTSSSLTVSASGGPSVLSLEGGSIEVATTQLGSTGAPGMVIVSPSARLGVTSDLSLDAGMLEINGLLMSDGARVSIALDSALMTAGPLASARFSGVTVHGLLLAGPQSQIEAGAIEALGMGTVAVVPDATLTAERIALRDSSLLDSSSLALGTGPAGLSTPRLVVDGGQAQFTSVLEIDPRGVLRVVASGPSTAPPVIGASGSVATLAGSVWLDALPGTEFELGDAVAIIGASTIAGDIGVLQTPGLDGNLAFGAPATSARGATGTVSSAVSTSSSEARLVNAAEELLAAAPLDASVVDLDLDGDPDLLVLLETEQVQALINLGTSGSTWLGFDDGGLVAAAPGSAGVAAADFDQDSDPDIALFTPAGIVTFLENQTPMPGGTVSFVERPLDDLVVGGAVVDITTANLDGDAVPDLAVLIEDLRLLRVYFNDALPGQFGFSLGAAASTADEPETVDTGDIDADKDLDLYVTSRSLTARGAADGLVEVFGNELQGQQPTLLAPISVAVGPDPSSLAIADFDLDGDIDAATADTGGDTVSILENAAGSLVYVGALGPGTAPESVVTLDADGGGEADFAVIATAPGSGRVVRLFRNDSGMPGPLVFALAQTITTSGVPRLLRTVDLDLDGRDDLIVLTESATPRGTAGGAATTWLAKRPATADIDGDGAVDAADLAAVLGAWGSCPANAACPADLNGDGSVGADDLANLLASWG